MCISESQLVNHRLLAPETAELSTTRPKLGTGGWRRESQEKSLLVHGCGVKDAEESTCFLDIPASYHQSFHACH